jgi:hypothetical protein
MDLFNTQCLPPTRKEKFPMMEHELYSAPCLIEQIRAEAMRRKNRRIRISGQHRCNELYGVGIEKCFIEHSGEAETVYNKNRDS